jgi:hypothetical protein
MTELLGLEKVLHVETWSKLHPATKLIVKVLQHIRSKLSDGAEVRIFYNEEREGDIARNIEMEVTTHKSKILITKEGIEFVRKKEWESQEESGFTMKVQRIKVRLPAEAVRMVKRAILDLIEGCYTVDIYEIATKLQEYIALAMATEEFVKFAKQNCPSCARPTTS